MIETVSDLVKRLKTEAEQLESIGSVDLACGVEAAVRVICNELDGHLPIGNADLQRIEPLERINKRLMAVLAKQSSINERFDLHCKQQVLSTPEYQALVSAKNRIHQQINALPKCDECNGKGKVKPMYVFYQCHQCGGTGVDLAANSEMIKLQQALILAEFELIEKLIAALFNVGLSAADKEAISVEYFYADCRTNLRCD
ncbi:conserved hypothetical protein [Shewanella sp. W3-18-1]|uniref:zinc finger-like domain-containing protein n=1 Tax=Shewanella sp. (strain W3-18-1) TaxID=351745 RepID=UPI00005FDA7B|nr:zinc finger-like domain-containing protein [Shewanella sp. W3-18-1]ABM25320.1 conserved hypothetical protein [Shewanella sp. W3-18-1]